MRYDADVTNPDSGQFDLLFDASAVNVTGVDFGSIGSNTVQLECWTFWCAVAMFDCEYR